MAKRAEAGLLGFIESVHLSFNPGHPAPAAGVFEGEAMLLPAAGGGGGVGGGGGDDGSGGDGGGDGGGDAAGSLQSGDCTRDDSADAAASGAADTRTLVLVFSSLGWNGVVRRTPTCT